MPDVVILAVIAGFILYRLYNVLGKEEGRSSGDIPEALQKYLKKREQEELKQKARQEEAANSREEKLEEKKMLNPLQELLGGEEEESARRPAKKKVEKTIPALLAPGVTAAQKMDPHFSLHGFMDGASVAFEMILNAYKSGDKETLKRLLSEELYEGFETELAARKRKKKIEESTLVSILSAEPSAIDVKGSVARITVEFVSKQAQVVKDKEGNVIEGDSNFPQTVEDDWIFERDLKSKSPNWTIVEL